MLKDFFFDMNQIALRKAKIVYSFSECNRVKEKKSVLSKDIKIMCFAIFSFFSTVKSRYMYMDFEIKKFSKKKSFLPTFQADSEPHIFFYLASV